jgi:hypothetical protein
MPEYQSTSSQRESTAIPEQQSLLSVSQNLNFTPRNMNSSSTFQSLDGRARVLESKLVSKLNKRTNQIVPSTLGNIFQKASESLYNSENSIHHLSIDESMESYRGTESQTVTNHDGPNFLSKIMKKQTYEDDHQKEGFVKIASDQQFQSIMNEFDSYYGADKLNEIENTNETVLDIMIKKRKQFSNRHKSKAEI